MNRAFCEYCKIGFDSFGTVWSHIKTVHSDIKDWKWSHKDKTGKRIQIKV